jgi:hypothetical protein
LHILSGQDQEAAAFEVFQDFFLKWRGKRKTYPDISSSEVVPSRSNVAHLAEDRRPEFTVVDGAEPEVIMYPKVALILGRNKNTESKL